MNKTLIILLLVVVGVSSIAYSSAYIIYNYPFSFTGTCADGQIPKFVASNMTFTCQNDNTGAGGGVTTFQNIGKGGKGFLSAISSSNLQSKNLTSTDTHLTVASNSTDVNIATSGLLSSALLTSQNVGKGTSSLGVLASPTSSIVKGKNMTAGTGISLSGNTTDITITNTLTQGFTSLANIGKGGFGPLKISGNNIQSKNITSDTSATGIIVNANTTDIKLSLGFKVDTASCSAGQAETGISNSTGLPTCATFLQTAITSLNADTTAAQLLKGNSLQSNLTVTDSGATHTIGLGQSVVVTNGTNQTITKSLSFSPGTKWSPLLLTTGTTPSSPRKGSIWINGNGFDFNDNSNVTQTVMTLQAIQTITGNKFFTGTVDFHDASTGMVIFDASDLVVRGGDSKFATSFSNDNQYKNNTITIPIMNGTADELPLENGTNIFSQLNTFNKGAKVLGLTVNATAAKTSSYSLVCTDDFVQFDTSSANLTGTLPSAITCGAGKLFMIKDIGLGKSVLTLATSNSQTIDAFSQYNMTHNNETAVFISDGTNYQRVSSDAQQYNGLYGRGTSSPLKFSNSMNGASTTTFLDVSATLYAFPLVVPYNMQIDKMYVEVSTAANPTSNTCRAGIYQDGGRVYPTKLVANSDSGTFDGTAAVKTLTFGSAINLQKGTSWLAVACATAATAQPTFRSLGTSANYALGVPSTLGSSTVITGYKVAFTFAAMPTTFPSGASTISTNDVEFGFEVNKG